MIWPCYEHLMDLFKKNAARKESEGKKVMERPIKKKTDVELRPCPFCGGEAVFRETSIGKYEDYRTIDFVIECGKCNASPVKGNNRISVKLTECGELCFSQDDRDKAAKAWNRRAE